MEHMRDERTMMELIRRVAVEDGRIRAAYMNGSRANPNADRDILRDYDIVFVVTDTSQFYNDDGFIRRFGDVLYMQKPDEMDKMLGKPVCFDDSYGWLVIYTDGNRLDIHVERTGLGTVYEDMMCVPLIDKDGILRDVPETTDSQRWVRKPSYEEFVTTCNEFWWCLNNVAKGIRRYEIPYAQDMLNCHVRPQLVRALEWKVGILTDFSVNAGKSGKYLYKWLGEGEYELFLETYCGSVAGEMWRSVKIMCGLFDDTARFTAVHLGFAYNGGEAEAAMQYFNYVKGLDSIEEKEHTEK